MTLLLAMPPGAGLAPRAGAAESPLPFGTFADLHVDQRRRHVFVSGGPGTNSVIVFGFDGRRVKRIDGLPGAADLLADGDRMYVALASTDAIAVLDLKTLKTIDTLDVSPYAQPRYLSKSGDTIYFTHSCGEHEGEFASIDLTTRVPVPHDNAQLLGCTEHAVVPDDPTNTMLAWDADGHGSLRRFNVTARRPVFVDQPSGRDWVDEVRFSSDGETLYVSNTVHYSSATGIDHRRLGDYGVVMNYPQGAAALALTPDERYIFTTTGSYDSDLVVYRTGSPAPLATTNLDHGTIYQDEGIVAGALGAGPAGDRVFAVVANGYYFGEDIAFRVIWPQYRVAAGRGDQSTPAAGGGYDLWTTGAARARHLALVARRGGKTFRVNPPQTTGFAGGVEGTKLVYQLIRGRQSDLRLYDLKRRRQISALGRLNTRGWEWHPTISRGRVLFTRSRGKGSQVILQPLKGGRPRIVARERGDGALMAGQVNGAYAVWVACGRACEVYRLNLRNGTRTKMPRASRRNNYGASVTRDGVVYYMQSGHRCGTNVELLRYAGGRVTQIEDLPAGKDGFSTFADDANHRVLFDLASCTARGTGSRWDVLSFRDVPKVRDSAGKAPSRGGGDAPLPPLDGEPWFEDLPQGGPS